MTATPALNLLSNMAEESYVTADLGALIATGKTFGTIHADPPWTFETWSSKGKGRSPERHYPTMALDDIKALPVPQVAARDCALFLWTTSPMIPAAIGVVAAWGFTYKTVGFTWTKLNRGGTGLAVARVSGRGQIPNFVCSPRRALPSGAQKISIKSCWHRAVSTAASRTKSPIASSAWLADPIWKCLLAGAGKGGPCGAMREFETPAFECVNEPSRAAH